MLALIAMKDLTFLTGPLGAPHLAHVLTFLVLSVI